MTETQTIIRRGLKSPAVAAILSAAVAAGVVGGVALAQTSAPAVITACVADGTGNVRIVGSAGDCRSNERPTTWNQQGPQGQLGPAGPAAFVNVLQNAQGQGDCVHEAEGWNECAPVTVHVPANQTYVAAINSAGAVYAPDGSEVYTCAAARRASDPFQEGYPPCTAMSTGIRLSPGAQGSVAANGAAVLAGGPSGTDWVIGTAVWTLNPLPFEDGAVIETLATVSASQ